MEPSAELRTAVNCRHVVAGIQAQGGRWWYSSVVVKEVCGRNQRRTAGKKVVGSGRTR